MEPENGEFNRFSHLIMTEASTILQNDTQAKQNAMIQEAVKSTTLGSLEDLIEVLAEKISKQECRLSYSDEDLKDRISSLEEPIKSQSNSIKSLDASKFSHGEATSLKRTLLASHIKLDNIDITKKFLNMEESLKKKLEDSIETMRERLIKAEDNIKLLHAQNEALNR